METSLVKTLLSCVFPAELIEQFDITAIEQPADHQLHITLVEKSIPPAGDSARIESKGFAPPRTIYDFPLRDRSVILTLHRRRWRNATTGKDIHVPCTLTAPGTSYTKEFGSFLKESH